MSATDSSRISIKLEGYHIPDLNKLAQVKSWIATNCTDGPHGSKVVKPEKRVYAQDASTKELIKREVAPSEQLHRPSTRAVDSDIFSGFTGASHSAGPPPPSGLHPPAWSSTAGPSWNRSGGAYSARSSGFPPTSRSRPSGWSSSARPSGDQSGGASSARSRRHPPTSGLHPLTWNGSHSAYGPSDGYVPDSGFFLRRPWNASYYRYRPVGPSSRTGYPSRLGHNPADIGFLSNCDGVHGDDDEPLPPYTEFADPSSHRNPMCTPFFPSSASAPAPAASLHSFVLLGQEIDPIRRTVTSRWADTGPTEGRSSNTNGVSVSAASRDILKKAEIYKINGVLPSDEMDQLPESEVFPLTREMKDDDVSGRRVFHFEGNGALTPHFPRDLSIYAPISVNRPQEYSASTGLADADTTQGLSTNETRSHPAGWLERSKHYMSSLLPSGSARSDSRQDSALNSNTNTGTNTNQSYFSSAIDRGQSMLSAGKSYVSDVYSNASSAAYDAYEATAYSVQNSMADGLEALSTYLAAPSSDNR